jgi:CRP/FNR family transcriptional regulator
MSAGAPTARTGSPAAGAAARAFPGLDPALAREMESVSERRVYPKGTVVYEQGVPCPSIPFLLGGTVRVYKVGENGREITLYRVEAGEVCVLSSSCALSDADGPLPAIAVAETEVEILAVPAYQFRRLVQAHPTLQRFINAAFAERLSEMMMVIEEVAFQRVDLRAAEWLLKMAQPGHDNIGMTHAQVAVELGSAREVISRILKDFERRGLVHLGRGQIEVTDRDALRRHLEKLKENGA